MLVVYSQTRALTRLSPPDAPKSHQDESTESATTSQQNSHDTQTLIDYSLKLETKVQSTEDLDFSGQKSSPSGQSGNSRLLDLDHSTRPLRLTPSLLCSALQSNST
jgi:hypothetical protein